MKNTAEVVIIGGGVAGVSTLYYLIENGVRHVILLEKNTVGSGTTAYSSAYVTLQEPDDLLTLLSTISFAEFFAFEQKFGVKLGDLDRGSLSTDVAEHSEQLLKRAEYQNSIGVPTQILTADEIEHVAPFLNVKDLGVGLLCKYGGPVDAHLYMRTYTKMATQAGARVEEDCAVTNIVVKKGRVEGVETTQGFISTHTVVNAAGIYAKTVGKRIGIEIPIINSLRHTIFTESSPLIPKGMPMLEILGPLEIYVEAKGNHADFTVGVDETDSFEHVANLNSLLEKHGADISYRMPEIAELGIVSAIAGIRSMTPDGYPILGKVDTVDGYFNNCGWGGSGVSLSPAGGKLLAEAIVGRNTLPLDTTPFLLSRFEES